VLLIAIYLSFKVKKVKVFVMYLLLSIALGAFNLFAVFAVLPTHEVYRFSDRIVYTNCSLLEHDIKQCIQERNKFEYKILYTQYGYPLGYLQKVYQ